MSNQVYVLTTVGPGDFSEMDVEDALCAPFVFQSLEAAQRAAREWMRDVWAMVNESEFEAAGIKDPAAQAQATAAKVVFDGWELTTVNMEPAIWDWHYTSGISGTVFEADARITLVTVRD